VNENFTQIMGGSNTGGSFLEKKGVFGHRDSNMRIMGAHLPPLLLVAPVAILFIGIVADPEETHAIWYGMLNMSGVFDL
jgi:hypothetical protein